MKTLAFLLLLLFVAAVSGQQAKFHVIRQWKYLNFTWPNEEVFKTAVATGLYIPENNVVSGVDYFEDFFYITLPRMKEGVPATLTRIKAGPPDDPSPRLEPFPSWAMNDFDDCNNLQNVQNVEIDTGGLMWIIDGGRINTLTNPVVKCPPKLIVFDIKNNRTTTVYVFPEDVAAKNGSFLYDIVVDKTDGGYAYITDNGARDPGIIVFSLKENRSWKIRHPASMVADPAATRFTVNDISISSPLNIAGIALGPKIHTSDSRVVVNEDREVYFSPISSLHLYSINTTVLRNENFPRQSYNNSIRDIGLKDSQTGTMVMDNQGILYYNLLGLNAVGRWDSHTPFQSGQRLIARDRKYLEWPSSFAFDQSGNLTVLTNRLNRFIFDKIDLNEYNFVLITAHVGGRSYLYDDNFNYDTDDKMFTSEASTQSSSSPEPVSTAKPEPVPSPEPKPVSSSEPVPNPEPKPISELHQDQQPGSATTVATVTNNTESSAAKVVMNLLFLVLSISILSVK